MIERCPIIPIEQHLIYYNGVNAELIKEISDLQSPHYVLDLVMCYAKLKIIVEKTPAVTCMNEIYETHNVGAVFKKFQCTFCGLGFIQYCTRQLKEELCLLTYKVQDQQLPDICCLPQENLMENLKNNGYDGILMLAPSCTTSWEK